MEASAGGFPHGDLAPSSRPAATAASGASGRGEAAPTLTERCTAWLARYPLASGALLGLVVFSAYAGALLNGFVYDDEQQILQNPFVLNPRLWKRIFTGSVWSFQGVGAWDNFYRPLQIFSYWLLYRVAGPNPAVFHLAQLLLYWLTAWLVYRIGRALLNSEVVAFAGALLWAVHPLHVEAVAWIGGWPEAGFGLFYLLGFLFFLRANPASPKRFRRHLVAALAYLPALFFKEMAVSFPLLVVAFWYFHPAPRQRRLRLLSFTPYLGAVVAYLAIRHHVLGRFVHLSHPWRISWQVVGAAVGLLGQHTKLFFWPFHLSAFRNFAVGPSLRSPWPWLILMVLAAALLLRRRRAELAFLLFWWPVTLVPCLDIRQLSIPLLADRFSYIPSAGLCLAVAFLAFRILPERAPRLKPAYALPVAFAVLCVLGIQTSAAVRVWSSDQALVRYSLQRSPEAAPLHIVEAWILEYQNGDRGGAAREFQTALRLNDASLRPLTSVTYDAQIGLGRIAYLEGARPQAIDWLNRAIRLLPNHSEAYQVLGSFYFGPGDYTQAANYFAQAVARDPQDTAARFLLGTCDLKLKRYPEAVEQFRAATRVDPAFRQAYLAEAQALDAAGDARGAAEARRRASAN